MSTRKIFSTIVIICNSILRSRWHFNDPDTTRMNVSSVYLDGFKNNTNREDSMSIEKIVRQMEKPRLKHRLLGRMKRLVRLNKHQGN